MLVSGHSFPLIGQTPFSLTYDRRHFRQKTNPPVEAVGFILGWRHSGHTLDGQLESGDISVPGGLGGEGMGTVDPMEFWLCCRAWRCC